jgi:hypothetical protein
MARKGGPVTQEQMTGGPAEEASWGDFVAPAGPHTKQARYAHAAENERSELPR